MRSALPVMLLAAAGALGLTWFAPAPEAPPAERTSEPQSIGVNLGFASEDSTEDRLFADLMKTARRWWKGTDWGEGRVPAALDAQFWPREDACLVLADQTDLEGTYACRFRGRAEAIRWLGSATGRVEDLRWDPATNTSQFRLVVSGAGVLALGWEGTRRSPLETGIRDLEVMRPVALGSDRSYAFGTLFTDQVQDLVRPFTTLRFMDYFRTNGNPLVRWSDRALPTDASQNTAEYRLLDGRPVGGCYEYAVAFCNLTRKDLWLNVPLGADDEFVVHLARLVASTLEPTLAVYVELSNEVWNTAPGFRQGQEALLLGAGSGLSSAQWAARRTGEISELFRSVLGDGALPGAGGGRPRVRPVLAGQQGTGASEGLRYLDAHGPRPVNQLLYGAGGSAYYGPDNASDGLTLDNLWANATMEASVWERTLVRPEALWAQAFGLRRVAYEGGPSFDATGHGDAVKKAAWNDPRMEANLMEHFDRVWGGAGGDLVVAYQAVGDHRWGFSAGAFHLDSPKRRAVVALTQRTRLVPSLGRLVPFSTEGRAPDVRSPEGDFSAYAFRLVEARGVSVRLRPGDSAPGTLLCDGMAIAPVVPGGADQVITLPGLGRGTHVLLVRTPGGRWSGALALDLLPQP